MNNSTDLSVLRVVGRLHWGYSIRTPSTSAAESALLTPPPSTLVGALARGLAALSGSPELVRYDNSFSSGTLNVLKFTRAASFSSLDRKVRPMAWQDVTRTSASPYLQQKYRGPESRDMWFGVHAIGRVYLPDSPVRITYVLDGGEAERNLGRTWRETVASGAWCITAIGGKEGMISIDDVKLNPISDMKKGNSTVTTRDYFPEDASVEFLGIGTPYKEQFWDFSLESGHWRARGTSSKTLTYVLPMEERDLRGFRPIEVTLSAKGAAVTDESKVGEEKEYVILLSEWLM